MVCGSRLCARWYERGREKGETARIRQIMHELGSQEHGARHHLAGVQRPHPRSAPGWALAVGKLN